MTPATAPPSRKEVAKIVKALARNKATGPDNISAEALQAGGETAVNMTHALITHIWTLKNVPAELGEATILLLPKNARRPKEPSLQRPISLTNIWFKVLDKALTERLSSHIEDTKFLAEPQYGFRKIRSTAD